jgi:hypothetical protein
MSLLAHPVVYFVLYVLLMLPTYFLPYLGSNSVVLGTASVAVGRGVYLPFLLHLGFLSALVGLALIRGIRVRRQWLTVFPALALVFDLTPGLNWIPMIPTTMHLLAMIIGVIGGSPMTPPTDVRVRDTRRAEEAGDETFPANIRSSPGQPQGPGANLAPQAQLQTTPLQIPELREQVLPLDPGPKEKVPVSTPVDALQRFANAFEELTLRASAILDSAKKEGYEVIIENEKITIKKASLSPVILYSNPEILGFGRSAGLSASSREPLAPSPSVVQPAPSPAPVAGVAAHATAVSRQGWRLEWNKFIPIGLVIVALLLTIAAVITQMKWTGKEPSQSEIATIGARGQSQEPQRAASAATGPVVANARSVATTPPAANAPSFVSPPPAAANAPSFATARPVPNDRPKSDTADRERLRADEARIYSEARGNRLALRNYVSTCNICEFETASREEIGNLESMGSQRRVSSLCDQKVDYIINATGVAEQYRPFVGLWTGSWNNSGRLCGGLVVETVRSDGTADLVYIYGPGRSNSRVQGKQQRRTGHFDAGGTLTFQDDEGSNFAFELNGNTSLGAIFSGRSGHLTGVFGKAQ